MILSVCRQIIRFISIYPHFRLNPCKNKGAMARVMVFNATFNNISVLTWRSVLLVKGNHRTAASH